MKRIESMEIESKKLQESFSKNQSAQRGRDALLNEYKGILFEYFVALNLAKNFQSESDFLLSLTFHQKQLLREYGEKIQNLKPELLNQLHAMALEFTSNLSQFCRQYISKVYPHFVPALANVVVHLSSKWGLQNVTLKTEGDIFLILKNCPSELRTGDFKDEFIPLSIKLGKHGSYINTKSAGCRSFLKKYFEEDERQLQFNDMLDFSFHQMAFQLYEINGLKYLGKFDSNWTDLFSELPGDQPQSHKNIIHQHYQRLANKMAEILRDIAHKNPQKFSRAILQFLGQSERGQIQGICFHSNHQYHHSEFYESFLLHKSIEKSLTCIDSQKFWVNIHGDSFTLQLRIKPMNKFTDQSYKINGAIHYEKVC